MSSEIFKNITDSKTVTETVQAPSRPPKKQGHKGSGYPFFNTMVALTLLPFAITPRGSANIDIDSSPDRDKVLQLSPPQNNIDSMNAPQPIFRLYLPFVCKDFTP